MVSSILRNHPLAARRPSLILSLIARPTSRSRAAILSAVERTHAGLAEARKAGRVGGRRPKLTATQQQEVISLVLGGQKSAAEAARLFQVHRSTVSRLIARHQRAPA